MHKLSPYISLQYYCPKTVKRELVYQTKTTKSLIVPVQASARPKQKSNVHEKLGKLWSPKPFICE